MLTEEWTIKYRVFAVLCVIGAAVSFFVAGYVEVHHGSEGINDSLRDGFRIVGILLVVAAFSFFKKCIKVKRQDTNEPLKPGRS